MSKIDVSPGGPAWFRSGINSFQPDHIAVDTEDIALRNSTTKVAAVLVEVKSSSGTAHWLTLSKTEALDLGAAISHVATQLP